MGIALVEQHLYVLRINLDFSRVIEVHLLVWKKLELLIWVARTQWHRLWQLLSLLIQVHSIYCHLLHRNNLSSGGCGLNHELALRIYRSLTAYRLLNSSELRLLSIQCHGCLEFL